ncbi:Na(+) H(+) exchange regulatory cofactor NHE-RF2-like [Brachionus plicatilis]|uniref:Na(+) H(+) exchange regulatory cofactor NHE-RF2-like n=1 Tax=Brachionus plicatilis TaxID=10195 RepID=A0A3M7Q3C9_BRAPC|nr:Na(+) H(+) exchange regulatory cofactor NHE-RF2-like [Brachionus plicatilis]
MKANESGPHMISSVESNSPAEQSGLRADDLILKVGDQSVVGERYTKTTTLIKNECEKGLLKLEVVDPLSCPAEVRNTPLVPPSGFSTISSASKLNKKSDSIKNLRDITSEMIDSSSPGRNRATSVDSASDRKRPYSMTDLDRIPANSTVRSITSIGTTATGYSQSNLANVSSKSVGNLSSIPAAELPKFKRCVVQLIPEYSEGFGFTLNSKLKPKYTIFSVDPDSPAYAANLRPTDVIVEINKKNIRRLKFDKVKGMLSESKANGQVEILAISKEGYLFFKNKKKKFSSRKLVTMDNTELHSTLDGIRSRASSVNNNRVSSDYVFIRNFKLLYSII